jgi:hypothetical protein
VTTLSRNDDLLGQTNFLSRDTRAESSTMLCVSALVFANGFIAAVLRPAVSVAERWHPGRLQSLRFATFVILLCLKLSISV